MAHQKRILSGEEYNDQEETKVPHINNQPRGINRLSSMRRMESGVQILPSVFSVVADLLQNESVTTLVQKRKEKQGEDSGLESGHTSMNAGTGCLKKRGNKETRP